MIEEAGSLSFVLLCSLTWYGVTPNEPAYRVQHHRVATELSCYDLRKAKGATVARVRYLSAGKLTEICGFNGQDCK